MATTLTIGDGVVVKYGSDASMVVRDGLQTGYNVNFTSLNDDSVAGQTQSTAGTPQSGDWRGVQILSTAAPEDIFIDGLVLQYAGSSNAAALEFAHNPYIFDALYISKSLLGIRALDATDARLTNLSLVGNTVGIEANQYAVPEITQSQIVGNGFGALNLTPQVTVQAVGNWWGSLYGPTPPNTTPGSRGDAVSAGVNYGQYLTAPPLLACSIRTSDSQYAISEPLVPLALYCVNARSYRLSESTDFGAAALTTMGSSPPATYTNYTFAGDSARTFTLYAQFASASGATTTVELPKPIAYNPVSLPSIQNIAFQSAPFADGASLTAPGTFTAQISGPSGIASVVVTIDGVTMIGGTLSGTQYTLPLTFSQILNGDHTLVATARDPFGITTQVTIGFTLAIPAPPAPAITAPNDGTVVNQPKVTISGTSVAGSQVQVYLDAVPYGSLLTASGAGAFSTSIALPDQQPHAIVADARTIRGTSPPSNIIHVTYTPPPPTIVITSPAKNATLTTDTDIAAAIIDTADITQVEFDIDGSAVATLTATPYTWHWALSSANSGSHTIAVRATDSVGNLLQTSIPVTVQITPPPPPPIVTPYTGKVQSITPNLSYGEQPITITGSALDRTANNPVPNALFTLVLQVNGFRRQIGITTGDDGSFVYAFHPYSTDAGTYTVALIHPQETTLTSQGQFTINRLSVSPGTYSLQAARTITASVPITVKASSGTGATGVYLSADSAAQPSGSLPQGITINTPAPINVAPGSSARINVQFTADNSGGNTGTVILVAHAADSASASRGTVAVNYSLSQPTPALFPQPTSVQTGVSQGNQVLASVKLQNKGLIAATNVVAQLLDSSGTMSAPGWITLVSGVGPTSLDVGASETIQLTAAPTSAVSDGVYQFRIRVSADNASGGDIAVSVSVTNSGMGNVVFNAADIFTATLDSSGNPIPGLAGATIKVQSQDVYTVVQSATTDATGTAEIDNLPIGNYTFVASAPNHSSASGIVTVQPGATVTQSVFLDYSVISISWSVTETDIPDEYQVTLNATYQTQVPAPVVLIEPTSINLPDLQVGEGFTGEMTITNYGLVRADDVVFTPPASDANFRFEFMGEVPTSLDAHQRISLPYKVTALGALQTGAGASLKASAKTTAAKSSINALLAIGGTRSATNATSGATCNTYSKPVNLTYDFSCANGTETKSSASAVFAKVYGQCTSDSGGGGSGGTGGGNDANGFGGPLYGCPVGQPLGNSPGCTPICISCLLKGGGFGGGGAFGGGPFGGGPDGPMSGGGPPPLIDGPVLQ